MPGIGLCIDIRIRKVISVGSVVAGTWPDKGLQCHFQLLPRICGEIKSNLESPGIFRIPIFMKHVEWVVSSRFLQYAGNTGFQCLQECQQGKE